MSDESKAISLILIIIAVFIVVVIFSGILGIRESVAPGTETTQCDHEFVVTSEYNWWLQSYRTYSKCIKCGLEM